MRFRRFSSRLLVLLLSLLFASFASTYLFVSAANERTALEQIRAALDVAARVFDEATRQRVQSLLSSAQVMAGDYTIKSVLIAPEPDIETLIDLLKSYTDRVNAPVIGLFERDGRLLAISEAALSAKNVGPFAELIAAATTQDKAVHSAFGYIGGELHVLVVVPLYAPFPNIHSWFGLAFPIDRAFAENIKAISRIEMTFVSTGGEGPRVLATTLLEESARAVAAATQASTKSLPAMIDLPDDRYVTLFKIQESIGAQPISIVLQRALSAELAGARKLQRQLLLISIITLAIATALALWIARGVSRPVLKLAAHTRHIAAGDYERRIELDRADELGQLAESFNTMSAGLAERDRIRDLLDKNVSPEVAAQLLRDGATLGGEEREVTILFADLRGFTALSEKLAPRDLLTLLNRHLDRMSAEIERHGGVIDKFIGDEIMALFGAPVTQNDAADRALAAALAMDRALTELNTELRAEGRAPLEIGIGINSARVVAGNIGSHRRLNYSVIGDGVNVAARLQSETRNPEHRARIITSAATLAVLRERKFTTRPLGTVQVKGRAQPVEIFAVESTN